MAKISLYSIGKLSQLSTYSARRVNMLHVDRAIGQFWKRLTSIIAVKAGHVENNARVFNMTTLHCNNRRYDTETDRFARSTLITKLLLRHRHQ